MNAEVGNKHENGNQEKELGVEMFEYIEAVVDKDVEEGLYDTKVTFSRTDESASSLQNKL